MVSLLKVGHIVSGVVAQTRPDYSAYLVFLTGSELYAFLPHDHAQEQYRVGADILACILLFDGLRIVLTQTSPQYYRRVMEALFEPLVNAGKIRIRRVASVPKGDFVKVALENLALEERMFLGECLRRLEHARHYVHKTITIVRYSRDIHEYIKEALVPAPKDAIRKVLYAHSFREAHVVVDPRYYGKFLGKYGANVSAAAKLLDIRIEIKKGEEP